jgi:hypothetical protein
VRCHDGGRTALAPGPNTTGTATSTARSQSTAASGGSGAPAEYRAPRLCRRVGIKMIQQTLSNPGYLPEGHFQCSVFRHVPANSHRQPASLASGDTSPDNACRLDEQGTPPSLSQAAMAVGRSCQGQ